jgi:hypothetical protein
LCGLRSATASGCPDAERGRQLARVDISLEVRDTNLSPSSREIQPLLSSRWHRALPSALRHARRTVGTVNARHITAPHETAGQPKPHTPSRRVIVVGCRSTLLRLAGQAERGVVMSSTQEIIRRRRTLTGESHQTAADALRSSLAALSAAELPRLRALAEKPIIPAQYGPGAPAEWRATVLPDTSLQPQLSWKQPCSTRWPARSRTCSPS